MRFHELKLCLRTESESVFSGKTSEERGKSLLPVHEEKLQAIALFTNLSGFISFLLLHLPSLISVCS